jgi:hypothetical protein
MHRQQCSQRYVRLIMTFTAGLLLLAVAAIGQENSGNVFGKVTDKSGAALPGATITLTGQAAPQSFTTDAQGQFRFLKLSPGKYVLRGELEGFSKIQRQVDVAVGGNTEVNLRLDPAVSETITVSAASPVIDRREVSTGASIEQMELKEVPTARDPWVVLQSVPGVLVDRVNIGGNKSGQQSNFVGKGVDRTQTVWNIDGVTSTDMSGSGGAAGFYLDFDSFQEFRVTTGSADPSVQTPGIQLNMVTKRGTNEFKGSGRYFWTGHQLQTDPKVPAEARTYLSAVNSINQISEVGFEAGGPIISDRLWMWGAYSRNPINVVVSGNSTAFQKTDLWNYNGKFNGQITSQNAGFIGYVYSNKTVDHRGIGPTRPVETSYNQSGPGWQYTLEDTHTFTPSLFLTGRAGRIVNGYHLDPVGGRGTNFYYDSNDIPRGSYWTYDQSMPQWQANVDGSKFFNFGSLNHELKFGFGYRRTPIASASAAPGDETYIRAGEAVITRAARPSYGSNYRSAFVGDTITAGNLTLNAGFRYDIQRARNNSNSVEANPAFPDLLPAATYPGDTRALEWKTISPRLSATYALGDNKRTLLRGSYARYADQISAGAVGSNNPFYLIQYLYFYFTDLNKNNRVERNELGKFDVAFNVDPTNPAAPFSIGRVDYNMKAPRTNEYILGIEREIGSSFGVGLDYTYRKRSNLVWTVYEKTRGAGDFYTAADFAPSTRSTVSPQAGTLPNGTAYNTIVYALKSGVPSPKWKVSTNRPDYYQSYDGIELTATKRMQNNWMLRGNITFNDWKQHVGPNGVPNGEPTPLLASSCSTCIGDSPYAPSGTNGYINSRWSAALNGVYQFPHRITVGAALTGRQGYIIPYYRRINARDGFGNKNILVAGFDKFRYPNVYDVDLRVAKTISLIRGVGLELSADLFNTGNQETVLQRDNRLRSLNGTDPTSGTNRIQELQSPRIWRFGARVTF